MGQLLNLAKMTVSGTPGTATTITLNAAATINGIPFLAFAAAGAIDGVTYDYAILDVNGSEIGTAQYNAGAGTLSNRAPTVSTNSNNPINASSGAIVSISPQASTLAPRLDFRNALYANGGLEIWQRGAGGSASFAVPASTAFQYCADRWFLLTNAGQASVVSQQAGLTNQSRWCAKILRNSGQTGTGVMRWEYPLTTDECLALRGQNITVQMVLQALANWSPSGGTLSFNAYFGTGTEGRRGATAYTGETNPLTSSVNLTPGGAAAQTIFTGASLVATNVTQGCLQFSWTPVGTAGAADGFNIDDVQLESGLFATQFERLTFAASLHECYRHYGKTFPYATAPAQNAGIASAVLGSTGMGAGLGSTVNGDAVTWKFPTSMRASPTLTGYNPSANNANIRELCSFAGAAADSAAPALTASTDGAVAIATSAGTNTTGGPALFHMQADAGL